LNGKCHNAVIHILIISIFSDTQKKHSNMRMLKKHLLLLLLLTVENGSAA